MDDDYAQRVVEHFLLRRQKASAESSRDQVQIEKWEVEGIPVGTVLDGIDRAFAALREPPKSVCACGRWVRGLHRDAAAPPEPHAADVPQPVAATLQDSLRTFASETAGPVARACATLADELDAIVAVEGRIGLDVLQALPEAFVELVLEQLPPTAAEAARQRAQCVAPDQRVGVLLEFVAARFALPPAIGALRNG